MAQAALAQRLRRTLRWVVKTLRSPPRVLESGQSSPMWLRRRWKRLVLPLLASKICWDAMALYNANAAVSASQSDKSGALAGSVPEPTRDRTQDGLRALYKLLLRVAPVIIASCEACPAQLRAEMERVTSAEYAASVAALTGDSGSAGGGGDSSDAGSDSDDVQGAAQKGADGDDRDGDSSADEGDDDNDEGDVDFFIQWASSLGKCKKASVAYLAIARSEPVDDPVAEEPLREMFREVNTVAVGCRAALATQALALALATHTAAMVQIEALPRDDPSRGEQTTAAATALREVWETKHVNALFDLLDPSAIAGGAPRRHVRRWQDMHATMERAARVVLPKKRPSLRAGVLDAVEHAWVARSSEAQLILGSERKRKLRKLVRCACGCRDWRSRSPTAAASLTPFLPLPPRSPIAPQVAFLGEIVGTHRQRALIVLTWVLAGSESWLHAVKWDCTGALFDAVAAAVAQGGAAGRATHRRSFLDALISVVVSEVLVSLVCDMRKKVERMWQEWIRLSLVDRVTHSVLSQDLAAVTGENESFAENSMSLLASMQDAEQWQWGIGDLFNMPQQLITDSVTVWSTATLLFRKNKLLTLLMLCVYPLQNKADDLLRNFSDFLAEWTNTQPKLNQSAAVFGQEYSLDSQLEDFESMRCHAQEPHLLVKLKQQQLKKQHLHTLEEILPSIFDPFFSLTGLIPNVICLWVGGRFVLQRTLAAGDLARFAGEALNLQQGATTLWIQLKTLWRLNNRAFHSGFALMDILEKKPKMGLDGGWMPARERARREEERSLAAGTLAPRSAAAESAGRRPASGCAAAPAAAAATGAAAAEEGEETIRGDIEFRDVSFKFPGMKKAMLKHVSFKVKAGSFVGVCGERGAGKTTLFKLIMRLYDVDGGAVLVDGRDVREYNPPWLRSQIGLSKQQPKITDFGTLRENVIFGAEDQLRRQLGTRAAVDGRIKEVLKAANIWDHFDDADKFPQGLDTPVYSWSLTGGETRSVGTARALLKDCKVMLLDEPTEGLDARNEKVIVDSLILKRHKTRTILCIAHRLSTIQHADSIIMMGTDGTIVAQGTYQHLVANCPPFAEFVEAQKLEGARAAEDGGAAGSGAEVGEESEGEGRTAEAEAEGDGASLAAAAGAATTAATPSRDEPAARRDRTTRWRDNDQQVLALARDLAQRCAASRTLPSEIVSSLERQCQNLLRYDASGRSRKKTPRRKKGSAPATPTRTMANAAAPSDGEFVPIPLVRSISAPSGRRSPL